MSSDAEEKRELHLFQSETVFWSLLLFRKAISCGCKKSNGIRTVNIKASHFVKSN